MSEQRMSNEPDFERFDFSSYSFFSALKHTSTREVFYHHLREEKKNQLVDFIEVVDDFTYAKSSALRRYKANYIFNRFINDEAKLPIVLPPKLKQTLESLYEKNTKNETFFQPNLFKLAQDYVIELLKDDYFPVVFKTEKYQNCLREQFIFYGLKEFSQIFLKTQDNETKTLLTISNYLLDVDLNFFPNIIPDDFSKDFINEILTEFSKPFTGVKLQPQKKNKKKLCFLGSDGLNWVKSYTQIDEEKLLREFFQQLIRRKFFAPVSTKSETFDENEMYAISFKKRVVIIGAGFAGMFAAKQLRDQFNVTVIDKKSAAEYNMSFYKLLSSPNQLSKYETPMIKVVDKCNFIQGTAEKISPSGVYIDGKLISYDYLIVGTGSSYSIPFEVTRLAPMTIKNEDKIFNQHKTINASIITPYSSKSILAGYYDLSHAKKIVVIGGGPVGVECAGELCVNYPNTKVILVTSGSTLLERMEPAVQQAAHKFLKAYKNSGIVFNRYVSRIVGNRIYLKFKSRQSTIEETYIETEAVIVCVGFRPNTNMFKSFMCCSLSPKGFVYTNPYFQVKNSQNDFTMDELEMENQKLLEEDMNKMIDQMDCFSLELDDEDDVSTGKDSELSSSTDDMNALLEAENEEPKNCEYSCKMDNWNFYMNIFAIGDIVDLNEEKLAFFSHIHGDTVARNIMNLESSLSFEEFQKKTKPYEPKSCYVTVISVGTNGILMRGKKILQKGKLALVAKNSLEKLMLTKTIPDK